MSDGVSFKYVSFRGSCVVELVNIGGLGVHSESVH